MRQPTMTRPLLFSALLITTGLLAPNAQAMGSEASLDLRYEVLEGETLYAVATAEGDLRLFNEGPGAVQVHWYDGFTGEKDQRILGPGKSLLSYGSLGAQVSEGTIVLLEQMGPGALSKGIASIPTQPQFRGCVPTDPCYAGSLPADPKSSKKTAHGLHDDGAFLPWHRGLYLGDDAKLHGAQKDGLLLLGDEPQDFKGANLHNNGAFSPFVSLEHGPGLHDSVHCIVGGTMCSATVLDKAILWLAGETKVSYEQCQGACYVDSEGVIWGQTIGKSLEHGPGLHDLPIGAAWQDCPPYEPCDDSAGIWSDGTFTSLSAGVQLDDVGRETLIAGLQLDDVGRDMLIAGLQLDDVGRETLIAGLQLDDVGRDMLIAVLQFDVEAQNKPNPKSKPNSPKTKW